MKLHRLVVLMCYCLTAMAAVAEPVPYRAVYKADYKGLPVSAVGVRELTQLEDNTYRFTSSAKSFFASITEVTTFSLAGDEPIAHQYEYKRSGIGRNKHVDLQFDWDTHRAEQRAGKSPWGIDIPPDTFDRLLYQFKMQEDLRMAHEAGTAWPELSYTIADDGRLRTYDFQITGEENVVTPLGRFKTLKAIRVRQDNDRQTTFWLSPEHNFMLVRFQQIEEDGKGFELLLKEADIDGQPVAGD